MRAPSVARRGAERVAVFAALEGRERSECIRDALGSSSWISKWIFLAKEKTKKTKKHWRLRRIQNSCFYEQSAVVLPALACKQQVRWTVLRDGRGRILLSKKRFLAAVINKENRSVSCHHVLWIHTLQKGATCSFSHVRLSLVKVYLHFEKNPNMGIKNQILTLPIL